MTNSKGFSRIIIVVAVLCLVGGVLAFLFVSKSDKKPSDLSTVSVVTPQLQTQSPIEAPAITGPYSGIYRLQELIDFDFLEGAQFDPSSNTLVLIGRKARDDRISAVPYLDYLAAASEASSPTFSLKWTEDSRQEMQQALQDTSGLDILDNQRRLNTFGAWLFQQRGINVAAGTDYDSIGEKVVAAGGLQKIFANKNSIPVPPELARLTFSTEPRMATVVKGMSAGSLLAQVAMEADIQSKYLGLLPELKEKLVGYQTYSEWEQTHGSVDAPQHTWISPDRFEIQESPDGQVMRFGQTRMKFNIEKYVVHGLPEGPEPSEKDPILSGYAAMLTQNYDALAGQFPIFQQLQEAFKVLAVADWLKRHGWNPTLPQQTRTRFDLPPEIPGTVTMEVTARATSNSGLTIRRILWLSGGIDLRVADNSSVVVLPDLGRLPIISPVPESNDQIRRIMSQKTEVPVPEIPGWVGQARGGQQALKYVALRTDQLSHCSNPEDAMRQLAQVKKKASMLTYYDDQINSATVAREPAMADLNRLTADAETKEKEFRDELIQSLISTLVELNAIHTYSQPILLLPAREAEERLHHLDQVRQLAEDLKAALERRESPGEYRIRWGYRIAELANELKKQWDLTNPQEWLNAREMAARRMLLISLGAHALSIELKAFDLAQALQDADELNQQMGDAARQAQHNQEMRQKYFDAYKNERAKLDAMMANCQ